MPFITHKAKPKKPSSKNPTKKKLTSQGKVGGRPRKGSHSGSSLYDQLEDTGVFSAMGMGSEEEGHVSDEEDKQESQDGLTSESNSHFFTSTANNTSLFLPVAIPQREYSKSGYVYGGYILL